MLFRTNANLDKLVQEMLDQIPNKYFKSSTATFLDPAMGGGQFVSAIEERLEEHGHSDENIAERVYGIENNWKVQIAKNRHNLKGQYDVADFLEDEVIMNFNVIIGNPPFSDMRDKVHKRGGAPKLYDKFFELALEHADCVIMIMPSTAHNMKTKHNDLIRDKANHIEYISGSLFPSVHMPMWYVVVDGSDNKPEGIDWVGYKPYPEQIYHFAKGKCSVHLFKHLLGRTERRSDNDVALYHKISGRDGLVMGYTHKKNIQRSKLFQNTGWAVLMPQQINVNCGWTETAIVKCDGLQAGMNGMNVAFVDTKREAKELVELMKTEEFINQAVRYMGGMNNMTLNAMMQIDMAEVIEAAE